MRHFPATQAAGISALSLFVNGGHAGASYERHRNTDFGPTPNASNANSVSHLSPYIRHRMLLETDVLSATLARETSTAAEKFIQEVCWRTYWKGWLEHRPEVWHRYTEQRDNAVALNPGILKALQQATQGMTGIECFDAWVEELITTGYLHNHTRMWFASIWIFTLNLPWASGADFFMRHLCDADAASNTLSWRWVAGLHTAGKHYLARADNIARYTNQRFNPRGKLNESATPKTESVQPKTTDRTAALERANFQSKPLSTATVQAKGIDVRSWLLLHDEDLSPDKWLLQDQLAGIIVLNSVNARSTQEIGSVATTFSTDALIDATRRLQQRWQLNDRQIIECASPAHLAKQLEGHQVFSKAPIVHAWIPVGPTQDALTEPAKQLRAQGSTLQPVISEWDQLAWPHATKGFFQFRTRIPELLRELGDGAGRLL
jgi:deoxyribodipyrimidine photo-lyase